jgi:hypothetical protein
VSSWARRLLLGGALAFLVQYLVIALLRIRHPFDLEWLEGAVLCSVQRILEGQPPYAAPSLDYVPLMYTPLYYYAGALSASLLGFSHASVRLVSLLASLACFGVVYAIVRRETRSAFAGAVAAGLFAATFRIGGAWFDVARVDSLFLALMLGAIALVQARRSPLTWGIAGGLLALAFLTKQSALGLAVPIALACLWVDRRSGTWLVVAFALPVLASTWWLDRLWDGWYTSFVFDLPRQTYRRVDIRIVGFWGRDLLAALPVASCAGAAWALAGVRARLEAHRRGETWSRIVRADGFATLLAAGAGALGSCWVQRVHVGGAPNVLMPAYALTSICATLALHGALERIRRAGGSRRMRREALVYGLAIAQLALLVYDPMRWLPARGSREAGLQLVERLARRDGEVFVLFHPLLATRAGKPRFAHAGAVTWLMMAEGSQPRQSLVEQLDRAFRMRRFAAVVSDDEWPLAFDSFRNNYRLVDDRIFDDPDVFWTVTGAPTRPERIYERIRAR